jgi:hypothetical protein
MADIVTVNNYVVSYILPEDGVICLLDCDDQVLAILPEDVDDVVIHMAIGGNSEGFFYDFNLQQEFLGVSRFEPK